MSKQTRSNPSGSWKMVLLLIIAGAASLMISSVSADTGVTIAAQGDQSYYLGENVVFSGHNYDSDSTYLFITGPGTFMTGPGIPSGGGKLASPLEPVVSGNPDSFTVVNTKPDKTWEYTWYTANLKLDAGTYNVYAVSQPKALDQAGPVAAGVGIIVKKPFITAEISPATISQGVPFTVSGIAEGNPETVQVWILGKNYYSTSMVSVNSDASFRYVVPQEVTSQLAGGQYFVIVQHPMENTTFDIDVSGDYVRSLQLNNGTNLFRISAREACRAATRQRHSLLRSVTPIMVMTPIRRSRSISLMREVRPPRQQLLQPLRSSRRPSTPRSSTLCSEQSSWQREL